MQLAKHHDIFKRHYALLAYNLTTYLLAFLSCIGY